ncbi:APC family permease [Microbacterium sp.]|uniref:APC family permease n=1 Tax=Microbacterium sp. TaxID=51671 RepID=UPI0025F8FC33|nr:APC family permease [Microbacterium sp.]
MTALDRAISRPEPVHDFGARSPLEGLDRRSVGFADVLAQSVAAVAPSAAAMTVILLVAGVAGSATVPAVALAALIALIVARTVSQFARRMVTSGSLYTYAARGLGPAAGLATGAAILVGYAFISVFALLGGAHYFSIVLERVSPGAGGQTTTVALLVLEAAVLAVVLVRGIRFSTRIAFFVELASVAVIVVLMIVLLVQIGSFDPEALAPTDVSPSALAAGAVLALTAFVGFESAATLGVEARAPLRNIPRAIVWTVIVAGGLYVLAAYTQVAGFRALGLDLAASSTPVNTLAAANGLDAWGVLVDVGIAASFLACAIASTTALTRVLFAMGRDGVAPAWLGRAHVRYRTPIAAVAVAVPLVALTPVVFVAAGGGVWGAMETVIVISAVGYIAAYAIVCVAAPVFLRRIGELTVGAAVVALASSIALVSGLVIYLVVEASAGNPGVWIALALAVAAGAGIAWRMRHGAHSLDGIGSYDEPVASEVLGGVARDRDAGLGDA